ncbi:hypothetical protein [Flavobacterium covae]|uniref:hypothetical protein n=1 Tax=Flavobacterium covae TaxID=2906076 RepID=UPI0035E44766
MITTGNIHIPFLKNTIPRERIRAGAGGVPQGLSLVVKADEGLMNLITNKDNARAKLKEAFDKFSWSALGNMIDEEWKKATANPCMVSHLSGKVVFVVASCFIGAGEANIASKFLQTVERLDVIGQAMGKFAKLSSPIVKAAFNKAGKLVILPLAKLEPQISIRLRTLFKENVRQLLNRTSDQVALSLHALDNGNFLWDNIEVSPEELAEILAKKLDPNKKEIVLLSCNDLASAQALAQATGKKVYTTDDAITIFENGIKRADNTKWYEVSSEGTTKELSSPPVKECSTCTGEGVEMGVKAAGSFDNFLTVGGKVKNAGNKSSLFNSFSDVDNTNIPSKYLKNEQRFNNLAKDPDQGFAIKKSTRKEAMTGLKAESQGILSNIERGPKGIEFYDANRVPWDVKTPFGDFFNVESIGGAIKKELTESKTIDGLLHPPGKFIDPVSGQAKFKNILLDCTYINESQLTTLRNWLKNQSGLTQDELSRIVEINVNIQ